MKGLVLGLMLVGSSAFAGPLDYFVTDLKGNTGFKVESAMPYVARDWNRGDWSAGSAFPFFHAGSYVYLAGALSKDISSANGKGELLTGVRLNEVTRPLVENIFDYMTLGNLDKAPFLVYLAKATSVGATVGHNFSYGDKVVINSYGIFMGFEVVFGGPNDVQASSSKGRVYLR